MSGPNQLKHDNAPVHKVKVYEDMVGVEELKWFAQSPKINPTEVWIETQTRPQAFLPNISA